jgi:hypothetical protein
MNEWIGLKVQYFRTENIQSDSKLKEKQVVWMDFDFSCDI